MSESYEIAVYYDIYFTDDYSPDGQVDWVQIASVPASENSFTWTMPAQIKGDKCRIGVRGRLPNGFREAMVISPSNFRIGSKFISHPAVVSPVSGETYRMTVPIVIDDNAIKNTVSQRAYYQIYYSSDVLGIDWTAVRQNVYIGYGPIEWDISDLEPSDDYKLKIILLEDDGIASLPVFIDNLKFTTINSFVIDTTPPVGTITIEGNEQFTKYNNIIVNLKYFDETTDVKSLSIRESDTTGSGSSGPDQSPSNLKTWSLTTGDGLKFVDALFKDYAGNIINATGTDRFFRTFISSNNVEISSFMVLDIDGTPQVWTAFNGDSPSLYIDVSSYLSITGEAISMTRFSSSTYLGIRTSDNKGILQRVDESTQSLVTIHSFSTVGSAITTMAVYDSKLYLGLENGELYEFNGVTVTLINTFDYRIDTLSSDGARLYISVDHTLYTVVYDGSNFINMDVVNVCPQIIY